MYTNDEILKTTKLLMRYNEHALNRFEQAKTSGVKGDFYTEVKPFADEVKQTTSVWKIAVLSWIKSHQQRNLHSKQIESTAENLEMVSIQAFFPETSRKRFIGHIQSIEYVLKSLHEALEESIKNATKAEQ